MGFGGFRGGGGFGGMQQRPPSFGGKGQPFSGGSGLTSYGGPAGYGMMGSQQFAPQYQPPQQQSPFGKGQYAPQMPGGQMQGMQGPPQMQQFGMMGPFGNPMTQSMHSMTGRNFGVDPRFTQAMMSRGMTVTNPVPYGGAGPYSGGMPSTRPAPQVEQPSPTSGWSQWHNPNGGGGDGGGGSY